MELILFGFNHKTSGIDEREVVRIADAHRDVFLSRLKTDAGAEGAVFVSTCNRVEIYCVLSKEKSAQKITDCWSDFLGGKPVRPSYGHRGVAAFAHLVRVAAGLDSMALGENEVMGQIKEAYQYSLSLKATQGLLNLAFQQAFRVAKQVRTETGIGRLPTSMATVALMLIEEIFGQFDGLSALVVGQGAMGRQVVECLEKRGVQKLLRANRTKHSEEIHSLDALEELLPRVDVVVTATGALEPVLRHQTVADALTRKTEGPLVLVDLGVPRDIDPRVASLSNVYLYNVDDLQAIANKNLILRRKEAEMADGIIAKAAAEFGQNWNRRLQALPNPHFVFANPNR